MFVAVKARINSNETAGRMTPSNNKLKDQKCVATTRCSTKNFLCRKKSMKNNNAKIGMSRKIRVFERIAVFPLYLLSSVA